MKDILFIQTGGTIDKDYPRTVSGYNFEFGEAAVDTVMRRLRPGPGISYRIVTVCKEDSQDITDYHRATMVATIVDSASSFVVITHGTDTLIETAEYLAGRLPPSITAVITGAFLPEKFRESDAAFNVGVAVGAVTMAGPGVWVAMGGAVFAWHKVTRNKDGLFVQT